MSHVSLRHDQLGADNFSETPWGDSPTAKIIGGEHKGVSCSLNSLRLKTIVSKEDEEFDLQEQVMPNMARQKTRDFHVAQKRRKTSGL